MVRVHVLVEGPTEETFVRSVLQRYFNQHETYLFPRLLGKLGHKGGIGEYSRARRGRYFFRNEPAFIDMRSGSQSSRSCPFPVWQSAEIGECRFPPPIGPSRK